MIARSILNLDKLTHAANNENLNGCSPNYNFVEGDINDEILVKNIFDEFKPDVLINFAAETHVDRSIDSPNIFINTNVLGTLNLLKLSLGYLNVNKKFKFIHVSTDEVYGSLSANELPFSEQSAYRPNSPYSASKTSSDF